MGASYNRRRYAADPEFRQGMIDASMQYQRKLAAEEPERAMHRRRCGCAGPRGRASGT